MWALLGVLMVLVMIDVRLGVLFSYQSNDQFSALQAAFSGEGAAKDAAIRGFWVAILILAGLIVADVVRTLLDIYLMQRFIIRWRVWLTHRLTGDWLDGDAYYRGRFIDDPIDNADQRIQQDIDIFTTGTGPETNTPTVGTAQTLLFGTVFAIVSRGRVHPDSVGSVGPADDLRCHGAEGAVLDGVALRVLHDGRGVLDRPPADPAVLPQRAHQRRVPLCVGAAARCGRGHRPLPRRRRRTRPADDHGSRPSSPTTGRSSAAASRSSAGTGR